MGTGSVREPGTGGDDDDHDDSQRDRPAPRGDPGAPLDSVGAVATEHGKVCEIYLVRNPDKLPDVSEREVRIL